MSVIITGMHRSGTSTVARLVDAFGLSPGNGPPMATAADNPRGYFERRDISQLNDLWLARLGGAWWAPPATRPATWHTLDAELLERTRAEYDLFRPAQPAWYSKDPRTGLLLPLWDRLALAPHPVILCLRPPADVATSLRLRNGFSARRAVALWMAYTAASLEHLGHRPTCLIDYPSMIASPAETVAAIATFLRATGHEPGSQWTLERAASLIEPHLDRATDPGARVPIAADSSSSAQSLYRTLAARHGRELAPAHDTRIPPDILETLDELRELYCARTTAEAPPLGTPPEALTEELRQASAEIAHLKALLFEARVAAEGEFERATFAEAQLRETPARTAAPPTAEPQPTPNDPTLEARLQELRTRFTGGQLELSRIQRTMEMRRAAMREMSAELERRRAHGDRLETRTAELTRELEALKRVEAAYRSAIESLLAMRFERDNLRAALERSLNQQQASAVALAGVLESRTWRLGNALAGPGRFMRRPPRGRPQ